jgi:assimilatory nitrate reductase catalytic subunit
VHPFVDPYSNQPDAKATPVAVAPVAMARSGFVLSRERKSLPRDSYWAWEAIKGGYAARIETDASDDTWLAALRSLAPDASLVSFTDAQRSVFRAALVADERLGAAIFLAPAGEAVRWTAMQDAWAAARLDAATRRLMLSGTQLSGAGDQGPNICACFGVPAGAIEAAIRDGCKDPAAIGRRLKAGTNCGSCIPEMKRMIAALQPQVAEAVA